MALRQGAQVRQSSRRSDVTRTSGSTGTPLRLPLDVVHGIFEFYILDSAKLYSEALHSRPHGRKYHQNILGFAHVCQDWYTVATGQSCYIVHDTSDENGPRRLGGRRLQADGRQRLEGLLQLLQDRRPGSGVKEFCYKTVSGSMKDTPALVQVIDTIKTTLTFFRLYLWTEPAEPREVDNDGTNGDKMRLLSRSLKCVERLEQLDMRIEIPMSLGTYVNLIQEAQSLRKCILSVLRVDTGHADAEGTTYNWRTFPHSLTPWHQLTTLLVHCTASSLPLVAIILTSGTVTRLQIGGDEETRDVLTHPAFQNLWSAMEIHCASLTCFVFRFKPGDESSNIPILDHLLPFLTSCDHLEIRSTDVTSEKPLLKLTNLKWLKITAVRTENTYTYSLDRRLFVADLLRFIQQERGVLRHFEVTYEPEERDFLEDSTELERKNLIQLEEEASRRNIEFSWVEVVHREYHWDLEV